MGSSSAKTSGESNPMRVLTVNRICTASRSAPRMASTRFGSRSRPAARAFAIDHRRGAAQVQIHRRHRILLQLPGRAHQRGNVVADHLRDHRPAGGVLGHRPEDVLVQTRSGVDPEVLRDIDIRSAISGHQPQERQVGDALHRRQGEHRRRAGQQASKDSRKSVCITPPLQHSIAPGLRSCGRTWRRGAWARTRCSWEA